MTSEKASPVMTDYEKYRTASLNRTLKVLKSLGVYQRRKNWLTAFTVISLGTMSMAIVVNTIVTWEDVNTLKKMTYFPSFFVTWLKLVSLCIHGPQLYRLVEMFGQFWKAEDFSKELAEESNKIYKAITFVTGLYLYSCILMVCSKAITSIFTSDERLLPYSYLTIVCDIQSLYCWTPLFIWESVTMIYHVVPGAFSFDIVFINCTTFVYVGCAVINEALKRLNTDDVQRRKQVMKKIVAQHDFILSFVNLMNDLFSGIMLIQFGCTLFSMTFLLNKMAVDGFSADAGDFIFHIGVYLFIVTEIWFYGLGGTIIEDQVKLLSEHFYNVEWYRKGRTDLRKDLAFMIFRAQNTRVVTMGKIADLNLVLFLSTMRTSFSIFTLIRQFAD